MKRLPVVLAAGILVIAGTVAYFNLSHNFGLSTKGSQPAFTIANGKVASYQLQMHMKQKPQGLAEVNLYDIEGLFSIHTAESGDASVSQWAEILDFQVLSAQVDPVVRAAMAAAPILTRSEGAAVQHFIGKEFPGRYLGMQLGLLDKIFIGPYKFEDKVENRRETSELGQYNVQYSYARQGENYQVVRKWMQSLDGRGAYDVAANTITYSYNASGQLVSAQGKLVLNFQSGATKTDIYTTDFNLQLKGNDAMTANGPNIQALKTLPRADLIRAEIESKAAIAEIEGELPPIQNIKEALARVDDFKRTSPGTEQQEIFSNIREGIMNDPSEIGQVVEKILSIKERDQDSQLKSSLLFGAMTASGLPAVADSLTDLAQKKCPDDFCRIQAITSLNTHSNPNASNGKAMIAIAHAGKDEDVVSAAYLAAGAVASKIAQDVPEITQALVSDLATTQSADTKVSVIKAMGNHGSEEYLPSLEKFSKSEDTFERSAALYSLRNIPNEGVTQILMQSLDAEGSEIVSLRALRALGTRTLSEVESAKVADTYATSEDQAIQSAVSDLLLSGYRTGSKGAEEALKILQTKSTNGDLKTYLDDQIREIDEDKKRESAQP